MFGLRFKNSGNFVPLSKDIVFPMRFKNSLLVDEDNFESMWSLPVSLPYNESLWRELNIPDNASVLKPDNSEHEVDILVAKALHYDGILQVLRSDKNKVEVNVWDKLFPDGFGEQTIKELMSGITYNVVEFDPYMTIQFTGSTPAFTTWTFHYGDLSWNISVLAGYDIDLVLTNLQLAINLGEATHHLHCTNLGSDNIKLEYTGDWVNPIEFQAVSVSGTSAILIDSFEWSQWVKDYHEAFRLQMEVVCGEDEVGAYNYNFFPMYNPDFYGSDNPDFTGWINAFDTDTSKFLLNIDATTAWTTHKYTVVPFIYYKTLFDKIFADAGITTAGNFILRQGFLQIVLYNTQSLDMWYVNDELVVFNKTITVSDHLPDMTVRDFLFEFKKLYNLRYSFNKGLTTISIDQKIKPVNKADWRNKLQATDPEYNFVNNDGITFISNHDSSDGYSEFFGLQHDDYIYGNGERNITSMFSWPSVEQIEDKVGPTYPGDEIGANYVPVAKQKGNSAAYAIKSTFTPRLLFYRGIAPNDNGEYYPYANTTTYDSLNSFEHGEEGEHTYDLTLIWSKLFDEFYSDWVEILDNIIRLEVSLFLPLPDVQGINNDLFYMFEDTEWLIEEIEIGNVYEDEILCRVTLIKEWQ